MPPTLHATDAHWYAREVQAHAPALLAYLQKSFPNLPDPEAMVQDAALRVWQARQRGEVAQPRAMLFAVARNLAIDQRRREKVVSFDSFTENDPSSVPTDESSPADQTARRQELTLLQQAIDQLPERCRQILVLRKIHGLSQREIAARLGVSENTVETQIGIGMRRCAAFLAQHGLP